MKSSIKHKFNKWINNNALPKSYIVTSMFTLFLIAFLYPLLTDLMIRRDIISQYDYLLSLEYFSFFIKPLILPISYIFSISFCIIFNLVTWNVFNKDNTINMKFNLTSLLTTLIISLLGNYISLILMNNIILSIVFSISIFSINLCKNEIITCVFLSQIDSIRSLNKLG